MTDPAMVPTEINGRWTLLLPEHRAVRPEWPWWERERLDAMHRVITNMIDAQPRIVDARGVDIGPPHRPLVYDIGAEEGDLPALWATWGARVALFEPNPRVWPNIRVIWEANHLPPPAWAFAGFAGPEHHIPDDVPLTAVAAGADSWPGCAYGPVIGDHGFCNLWERPDLPVTTIDHAPGTPDVLTLDVEGAEYEVLRGAERTLTDHHPVVFVSIHPEFMLDMYGYRPDRLQDYMRRLGYRAHHLATDHEEHWIFQHPNNEWWRP
jgi:hypothetical protein